MPSLFSRVVRQFCWLERSCEEFACPASCAACGRALPLKRRLLESPEGQETEVPGLCNRCEQHLAPLQVNQCMRCGAPVGPHLLTDAGCARCRDDHFAFQSVVALGVYRGNLRLAMGRMKRGGGECLTAALTGILLRRSRERLLAEEFDAVVPVPHHWTERVCRAHIPATTMADACGRFLLIPVERHILRKVRRTKPQTALTISERRRNLQGAFQIAGNSQLRGASILLVDDVLTTGTTAHRAARELRLAGARQVHVCVLARGIGAGAMELTPGR